MNLARRLRVASWPLVAFVALFGWHLSTVSRTAVDVPYWDDLAVLRPEALPSGLTWTWLYARHNESRKIPTKLQIWALYKTTCWNINVHQTVNFLLFGLVLTALAWAVRRAAPDMPPGVLWAFMLFTVSPATFENHSWAVNSCIHFAILFFLLAAVLLTSDNASKRVLGLGAAAAWLCVNSYSSGPAYAVALILGLGAALLAAAPKRRGPLLAAAAAVVVAILVWSADFVKPPGHPDPVLPHHPAVWTFVFNLIALGFGIDQLSAALGAACLALVAWPLIATIRDSGLKQPASFRLLATATIGTLGVLLAAAMGRVPMGLDWSKNSRYAEFAMLLVPLTAAAWHHRLRADPRRPYALAALWLFCAAAYSNNWSFSIYDAVAAKRREGLACVARYYREGGDAFCPTLYRFPIAAELDQAKRLNLSFYQTAVGTR